jgi:hypothetical protein
MTEKELQLLQNIVRTITNQEFDHEQIKSITTAILVLKSAGFKGLVELEKQIIQDVKRKRQVNDSQKYIQRYGKKMKTISNPYVIKPSISIAPRENWEFNDYTRSLLPKDSISKNVYEEVKKWLK